MKLCNFMANLGALAMPKTIAVSFPDINFHSKYTDLLMIIRLYNQYRHIYVLDTIWLNNKDSGKKFYYSYDIFTNFYKTKDEQTGLEKVAIDHTLDCNIRIFLGRYYI